MLEVLPHLAALQWRSHLNPILTAVLIFGTLVWFRILYKRLQGRFEGHAPVVLLAPKAALLLLLVLALFEPVVTLEQADKSINKLLLAVDVSSSMEVEEAGDTRSERAASLEDRLRRKLPSGITLETVEFDTDVRPRTGDTARPPGERATDLGGLLLTLAGRADISTFQGVVILTDGGDEALSEAALPPIPVSILGIGSDNAGSLDLGIDAVDVPASVEMEADFEIVADIRAQWGKNAPDAAALSRIPVILEREDGEQFTEIARETVDLSRGRARVSFTRNEEEESLRRFRLTLPGRPEELSLLNNNRTFSVDVRSKTIHALYFSREIGVNFKSMRAELGRDPGITFTALFRTLSERFTVLGDRIRGDDELSAGFPSEVETLRLYDVIIIGAFPAEDWAQSQFDALMAFVENGGAVIFLGGPKAFGLGGYADSPITPLFPWKLDAAEPPLMTGTFPVQAPVASRTHPIMRGMENHLAAEGATLESLHQPGPLKPGGQALLNAAGPHGAIPVIARQPFGKGQSLGLATNTLWRWSRGSADLRAAYGLFWRQAVRALAGSMEGGAALSVRWDAELYRPGEPAEIDVQIAGDTDRDTLRFAATLTTGNQTEDLSVNPVQGLSGTYSVKMRFGARGDYTFRLVAYEDETLLETYEKVLPIGPMFAEGAHLEVDHAFLKKLTARTAGYYAPEHEADDFFRTVSAGVFKKKVVSETALVQAGPWFFFLIVTILICEWIVRRKYNLF